MRNVSEQARVYKDELYIKGIGGVKNLDDLRNKLSIQKVLGGGTPGEGTPGDATPGGSGESFPLEIYSKFSESTQEPLVVNVEYNKWYFILVNCPLIIKLPEVTTDVVKEVMITCAIMTDSPEVIFVPAETTDNIYEQLNAPVDSLGFYEFSCAASTVSILGSPRPSWFISNTQFDSYPTTIPDDIYEYLESLENSESSEDNGGNTGSNPGREEQKEYKEDGR